MSEIFENGYLKSEFINPNYRGLVGWPCGGDLIKGTDDGFAWFGSSNFYSIEPLENIDISQFTPKGIPVDELCWCSKDGKDWCIQRFLSYDVNFYTTNCDTIGDKRKLIEQWAFCTPMVIAETAEDAERMKLWATR